MKAKMIPVMALLVGAPGLALADSGTTSVNPSSTINQNDQSGTVNDQLGKQLNDQGSVNDQAYGHGMAGAMENKLGLDSAASQKFEQTNQSFREQMKPVIQDAQQTEQALKAELAKQAPDTSKLTSLSDQLTSDHQKIVGLEQQKLGALKSQLTPQQYAQFLVNRGDVARGMFHNMQKSSGQFTAPTPGQ